MSDELCPQTGKRCFTQREAGDCLRGLKENKFRRKKHSTLPKRYYRCQFCGMYHLTHYSQKKKEKYYSKPY